MKEIVPGIRHDVNGWEANSTFTALVAPIGASENRSYGNP